MKVLPTIFRFEWKKFLRSPVQLLFLAVFLLLGGYGIFAGRQTVERQQAAIAQLQLRYDQDFDKVLAKFHPDTSALAKRDSAYAGMPVMVNYWLPQVAVHPLPGLGFLSIGQRDIYPYFKRVSSHVDYLDASNAEISNPLKLFVGSLDLAFVLVYLLPLLLLGLFHNVLAEEKELGTYGLLMMQGVSRSALISGKLIFKSLLVAACVVILNLSGFALADHFSGMQALLWILVTFLYLIFWISLFYCILLLLGNSSALTAFSMMGVWLVLVMALPAAGNAWVSLAQPVPLRTSVASYSRRVSEEIWNTDQKKLVATFLKHNANYRKYYRPENDTESWGSWPLAGYYDLKERKTNAYAQSFEAAIARRNTLSARFALFSPVSETQGLFNTIAGTSRQDHLWFEQQSRRFQKQWRDYIYSFKLPGKTMRPADFETFPVFDYRPITPNPANIALQLLTLLLPTVFFLALARQIASRAKT